MRDLFLWTLRSLNFSQFEIPHAAPSLTTVPHPQIVKAFSATCSLFFSDVPAGQARVLFDADNKRENLTWSFQSQYGNLTQHFRGLILNTTYMIQNGRCEEDPGESFQNMFAWVPLSKFVGTQTLGPLFENRTCDMWSLEVPFVGNLSICVQQNEIPVLYAISSNSSNTIEVEQIYFGKDLNTTAPPASEFVPPPNCFVPDPPCPNGAVAELEAFIFHPAHMFDLINEDVGDLLGDTVFICNDVNNTSFDHFQWVSRYSLQVWAGWGQYSLCNRPSPNQTGVCTGEEKYLVGREAPYGIKAQMCGQCTDNSDVGNWYSLPTAGLCNSTQSLGPDSSKGECSWRVVKRLKTIDSICLVKTNGMGEMCAIEGDYPFTKTCAIMLRSFDYDDPAQGGCPAIA
jgi:hypothetical protein